MNHETFLQAIRDEPDDDIPRLVYADWLEENGQAERAEFIRTQVELPGVRDRGRSLELLRQLRALMVEYRDRWLGPLATAAPEAVFERGFVQEVTLDAGVFLDMAEQLLATHPITRVRLVRLGGLMGEIAACEHLGVLTGLDLSENHLDDQGALALAGSPNLSRLAVLELRRTGIRPVGLSALVSSPRLAGLTTLSLRDNQLGDEGVEALVQSLRLPRLTRLDLSQNAIGGHGAELLAGAESLRSLQALLLRLNRFGRPGVERLAASEQLAGLAVLDLTYNLTGQEGQELRQRLGPRVVV